MIRILKKLTACLFAASFLVAAEGFVSSGAKAEWREKIGTFRVGIVGGMRPILETRRAQPFREALAKALKMPVEIFATQDIKSLIEAHVSGRIEYAVYTASAFSAAWTMCKCVEPLVAPSADDGSLGFSAALIARKGQGTSVATLAGQKILVPGRRSFSGYILPKDQLGRDGIELEGDHWEIADKGSMEKAISAFRSGEGAAIFGWIGDVPRDSPQGSGRGTLAALEGDIEDLSVVWSSPLVFHGPHAVRKSLPTEAKDAVRDFLTNLKSDNPGAYEAIEPYLGGGFIDATVDDYRVTIDLIRKISATPEVVDQPKTKQSTKKTP